MVNAQRTRLRRREIAERDLGAVVDLLVRGFPARRRRYWEHGLRRMGERPAVEGCPRFGFLLEGEAGPVGVSLMLFGTVPAAAGRGIRCNLSSWAVDPAYRAQAPLLVASVLKRRDVTFTNTSPAPHTWATIEAQGFRAYASGQVLLAPALAPAREPARVVDDPQAWRDLPEARLLDDHRGFGCTCFVVEAADGLHPFVVLPFRPRAGRLRLPVMQVIYVGDVSAVARFGAPVGRWLLGRGVIGLVVDGGPLPGGPPVLGRRRAVRKYCKGPHPPRLGDLSYTERVIFGP